MNNYKISLVCFILLVGFVTVDLFKAFSQVNEADSAIAIIQKLKGENEQLRSQLRMYSLAPLSTPAHLRAQDMRHDVWWLSTDTNHWFTIIVGTNHLSGPQVILHAY